MQKLFLLALGIVYSCACISQNNQLKGKLIDEKENIPLIGITIKLNNNYITTDNNGNFFFTCTDSVNISVTSDNYLPFKSNFYCTNSDSLIIKIKTKIKQLDTV